MGEVLDELNYQFMRRLQKEGLLTLKELYIEGTEQVKRRTSDATAACPTDWQRTPTYPKHRKGAGQCVYRSPCQCNLSIGSFSRCLVLSRNARNRKADKTVTVQVRGLYGG